MKIRIDELLVQNNLFESRSKAQANIIAGNILADEVKIEKAGTLVKDTAVIRVLGETCPFVSRGGLKIEKGLNEFKVDVNGIVAADIGAGTGGFTDCLLQRGAKKIFAIDVGYGQIAWKIRQDPKVIVMDRCNARELRLEDIGEKVDLIVMDVSFISIIKVLPALLGILKDGGNVVTLVKPQFEAGKGEVPKGGVIRDTKIHKKVLDNTKIEAEKLGFVFLGQTISPITGREGNIEYLMHLRKA